MSYNDIASLSDVTSGKVRLKLFYQPMKDLEKFHGAFAPNQSKDELFEILERRNVLITEEYEEVIDAISLVDRSDMGRTSYSVEEAKVELAAELADLLYVVYGTAEELGIPLQEVFQAIHAANMGKVWDDGQVHRNDYGKIIKPPNFVKADIWKVMYGSMEKSSE